MNDANQLVNDKVVELLDALCHQLEAEREHQAAQPRPRGQALVNINAQRKASELVIAWLQQTKSMVLVSDVEQMIGPQEPDLAIPSRLRALDANVVTTYLELGRVVEQLMQDASPGLRDRIAYDLAVYCQVAVKGLSESFTKPEHPAKIISFAPPETDDDGGDSG